MTKRRRPMSAGRTGAASDASLPRRTDGRRPVDASPQNTRCVKENLACHWPAFTIVGVEQGRAVWFRCRERELPAEVRRILDGGVHPLPCGRGVGVGGIPGQVQPPLAEPLGHAVL